MSDNDDNLPWDVPKDHDPDKCPHLPQHWELKDDGYWWCTWCKTRGAKGAKG